MGLPEARRALKRARRQLARVQVAWIEPADPTAAVTFAFYAYENAVVAVAEARAIKWTKVHHEKANLARKLFNQGILATNAEERLLELNDLRKDVAYDEPGPELEQVDLEDLARDLELFIDEVEGVIDELQDSS